MRNASVSVKDVMKKLEEYVDDINENIQKLESRGPVSKYVLPNENIKGRWDLSILPELANSGLAFNSKLSVFFILASLITYIFFDLLIRSFSLIKMIYYWFGIPSLLYSLTLTFNEALSGVACDLNSRGFHVLCKATEEVVGHVKPYSITGSLPLIRELQVKKKNSNWFMKGVCITLILYLSPLCVTGWRFWCSNFWLRYDMLKNNFMHIEFESD